MKRLVIVFCVSVLFIVLLTACGVDSRVGESPHVARLLQQEVEPVRDMLAAAEEENLSLQMQLDAIRAGNPSGSSNPTSETLAALADRLEALEDENLRIQEDLGRMQDGNPTGSTNSPNSSNPSNSSNSPNSPNSPNSNSNSYNAYNSYYVDEAFNPYDEAVAPIIVIPPTTFEDLAWRLASVEESIWWMRDSIISLQYVIISDSESELITYLRNRITALENENRRLRADLDRFREACYNIGVVHEQPPCPPDVKPPRDPQPPPPTNGTMLGRDIQAYRLDNMLERLDRYSPIVATIMGVEYTYGLTTQGSSQLGTASIFYNIGGRYTTFTGYFGPQDDVDLNRRGEFRILGDGILLTTLFVNTGDPLGYFSVDVSNVMQLRIDYVSTQRRDIFNNFFTGHRFAIVDAVLWRSPAIDPPPAPPSRYTMLSRDIQAYRVISMVERHENQAHIATIMGVNHTYGIITPVGTNMNSESIVSIYYNIGGRYTTLSGSFGPGDDSVVGRGGVFVISGDGYELYRLNVASGDILRHFSVDVSGVTQLRINFISNHIMQLLRPTPNSVTGHSFAIVDAILR